MEAEEEEMAEGSMRKAEQLPEIVRNMRNMRNMRENPKYAI